ncbi:MAG: DUF1501 domain-containing protein [Lautropia sp.]|nr:DUF1501 domain-containing protein [Lautropia sp.]
MSHDHDHHHDHEHDPSRRALLKGSAAAIAGQVALPFALNLASMGSVAAQSSGNNDYKALICLFLHGGNDHANTVVATNGNSWERYKTLRSSISLPAPGETNGLLSISPSNLAAYDNGSLTLALHPSLTAARDLFNKGKLAILSNVGPLIEPTTVDEYQRMLTRIPSRLYSHNDQQSTWQTFSPEGSQVGWGGKLIDRLSSSFNGGASFFGAIAPGNNPSPWLTGERTSPYAIPTSGTVGIRQLKENLGGVNGGGQLLRDLLMLDRNHAGYLEQTLAHLNQRTIQYQQILQDGLVAEDHAGLLDIPLLPGSATARNSLAVQLRMIARIIASRNNIGARRQVFFIQLGGFDMHSNLLGAHKPLLDTVDQALDFFSRQMASLGVEDKVTLFTASDFGRTIVGNGSGSDHAWGSHHFIVGGAVNGGKLYGKFPEFGINAGNDARGRLVPNYSVEQYAAALGEWFGLSQSELMEALPNLRNFDRNALRPMMKI